MTTPSCAFPVQFRQPSVSGLSQITKSLYISNGVAANNKLMLSSNQITMVINVSVERGDEAGPYFAALRCWCEPLSCPVPRLPHEVPRHVPAGCPHMDQVMPAHHPTQQRLLGAAHPL
ncbi:dual specificity protein phosphatase 18 isoform X2 [Pongo pygmaeus]|uniref:dual specificity protein phosphatase 18 isoform X2 n=1 Tax=Pongo pygmaeus TaxID=9600 RepID=UPI0023E2FD77|nr:dual specificity protein phosphatase 18 isoform X2 [Pongo pygmaeus]